MDKLTRDDLVWWLQSALRANEHDWTNDADRTRESKKLQEIFDLALSALEREGWILVSERLPEAKYGPALGSALTSEDVAVILSNDERRIANCTQGNWYDPISNQHLFKAKVTHWCPLPAAPKGGT